MKKTTTLTERQQRELDYHREHAKVVAAALDKPFIWDVLDRPMRRWWNAYWRMFAHLQELELCGKRVLVVGCGIGSDAIRLARLGAEVHAFDLSADLLEVGGKLAQREGEQVHFAQMPAEHLHYEDDHFDLVLACDILHHVDIPLTMAEIRRVAKPGAHFVFDEIYSHSLTNTIRHSALVEKFLYPRMTRLIYGTDTPYITEDERKLTERDVREVCKILSPILLRKYFNFLVTRVIPERYNLAARLDRLLLMLLSPVAHILAGRVLISGRISKRSTSETS
ncbi:MAG: class I SAM-dependent methyltransferase [Betaproteobacteria bacterium]|nr:class I SAM-dependent methyltransferase [Betaproteobacteria bacterium]